MNDAGNHHHDGEEGGNLFVVRVWQDVEASQQTQEKNEQKDEALHISDACAQ
jgi:hypothetical protein